MLNIRVQGHISWRIQQNLIWSIPRLSKHFAHIHCQQTCQIFSENASLLLQWTNWIKMFLTRWISNHNNGPLMASFIPSNLVRKCNYKTKSILLFLTSEYPARGSLFSTKTLCSWLTSEKLPSQPVRTLCNLNAQNNDVIRLSTSPKIKNLLELFRSN